MHRLFDTGLQALQHRKRHTAAIICVCALMLLLIATVPLFQQHPFPSLYASAVFATWYGNKCEALMTLLLSAIVSGIFMPPLPALPLEGQFFICVYLLLLITMRQWQEVQRHYEDVKPLRNCWAERRAAVGDR